MSETGQAPDPWQAALLRGHDQRILLLASRQSGKSQTAGALALVTAIREPRSLILLLSPTERQSGELFKDKVLPLYRTLCREAPAVQETALTLALANGSRIIALPGKEETIRSYSGVRLLVIDEASRVPDSLYRSVRPMLAVSQGRLLALTTPWGKRGWFYEEWVGQAAWRRVKIRAADCPRITAAFLAEERAALGERWFNQEYNVSFEDMIGSLFSQADLDRAFTSDRQPLEIDL